MSGNITFLVYRLEWHRRRAEALQAARTGLYRQLEDLPSCKIYWAADTFAHRSPSGARPLQGPLSGQISGPMSGPISGPISGPTSSATPGTTEGAAPDTTQRTPLRATDWRDPCTIADLQTEPD
ncbi:hypothetical protein [Cupriavidus cauae]|uniref:Uncharacterized protein n=1 Tax=Cupriavidus cauae TaxID=2608999 RepID=A0A5M8B1P7_9BURK|nr:hypothetical protein [Cupriavidus cauae]KAA6129613.1 hypothetical protein F1599_04825 [Cupriavidus cauae]